MRAHARWKRFTSGTSRVRGLLMAARTPARRHWLFTIVFCAGLSLRILTQVAYSPALVYIDSYRYLHGDSSLDPLGYLVLLWPLQRAGGLAAVAAAQHILGLGMAVSLYSVLLRRGMWRWAAALAAAPVLLDGYQLQAEQTIMPDVLFEALIVAGLALLLWRRIPAAWQVGLAGLALGVAVDVRQVGEVLIVPALAFLLVRAIRRQRLAESALFTVGSTIPVLIYHDGSARGVGSFHIHPAKFVCLLRARGRGGRLRYAQAATRRAKPVPITAGGGRTGHRWPGRRSRRPAAELPAAAGHDDRGHGRPFRARGRHAAADGRGQRHPPRFHQIVRPHQEHRSRGYADQPLAIPDHLSHLSALDHLALCRLDQARRRPAIGHQAAGRSAPRLPASRRVHTGAPARGGRAGGPGWELHARARRPPSGARGHGNCLPAHHSHGHHPAARIGRVRILVALPAPSPRLAAASRHPRSCRHCHRHAQCGAGAGRPVRPARRRGTGTPGRRPASRLRPRSPARPARPTA